MAKFSQSSHDKNDERAREKAKQLLSKRFDVKDNPDKYGIDLLCYKDKIIQYYIDVEIKNLWAGQNFPWADINCLTRKEKYYKMYPNSKLMLFNTDLTSCFIMSGKLILSCPKVEVPNQRQASGELFFKVPVSKAIYIKNI